MSNVYFVRRPENDDVVVFVMLNRVDNKYHFVNLTKGHICECAFDTVEDALEDMEKLKNEGKILEYVDYFEMIGMCDEF